MAKLKYLKLRITIVLLFSFISFQFLIFIIDFIIYRGLITYSERKMTAVAFKNSKAIKITNSIQYEDITLRNSLKNVQAVNCNPFFSLISYYTLYMIYETLVIVRLQFYSSAFKTLEVYWTV